MRLKRAFTLLELLVVLAIIAIVAALLLPALAKAKMAAQRSVCRANMQQLNLGCKMYSDDCNGQLVSSYPIGFGSEPVNPYSWCPGWGSTAPHNPTYGPAPQYAATNTYALMQGKIWPYLNSAPLYRCPADSRRIDGQPVVRSFSMNSWLNGATYGDPTGASTFLTPEKDLTLTYTFFRREGQIQHPERIWRLVEEDDATINDSMFLMNMGRTNGVPDRPSNRHGPAFTLTFVDGHSETLPFNAPISRWAITWHGMPNADWINLKSISTVSNKNYSLDGLIH